jgi:dipeptidyl aminopeptidase/acylaminoacyl peptidase
VTVNHDLLAVSAEGGPAITLSPFARNSESNPAWSPDGQRIAFVGGPARHVIVGGNIYVVNADGSGLLQLTNGLRDGQPAWSPDGTRLTFVVGQGTALVVIDADGTDRRVISRDRGFYQVPTWSPDGSLIAFRSTTAIGSERVAVFTIHPDGSGERRLPVLSGGPIVWSPDGSQLAYPGIPNVVWVMDVDGSDARRITTCNLPCVADLDPTWSPDGTQIAFIRQEDGGGAFRLYVVDLATGVTRGLTPDLRYVSSPTWRPASTPSAIGPGGSVVVPDLIGFRDQQALGQLDRLDLHWVAAFRSVEGAEPWRVVETDPAPGTSVVPGSTVRIVIATTIAPLPQGAADALPCPAADHVAFGGPRIRLTPAGSAYIEGNTPGISDADKVVQVTSAGGQSGGIWHVIRDGQVIAVIAYPSLDGEACLGSGVAGA